MSIPPSSCASNSEVITKTIAFVQSKMQSFDASHDWNHIQRVWSMAVELLDAEGIKDVKRREMVELAALLHDVYDHKYMKSDIDAGEATIEFLCSNDIGYDITKAKQIAKIINNMSFSSQLMSKKDVGAGLTQRQFLWKKLVDKDPDFPFEEMAIVSDADKLDALGAIGIARCFTYGAKKGRALHDPSITPRPILTKEDYLNPKSTGVQPSINHFYEKVLKLKDLMLTSSGIQAAQRRHNFVQSYVAEFEREWEGHL